LHKGYISLEHRDISEGIQTYAVSYGFYDALWFIIIYGNWVICCSTRYKIQL